MLTTTTLGPLHADDDEEEEDDEEEDEDEATGRRSCLRDMAGKKVKKFGVLFVLYCRRLSTVALRTRALHPVACIWVWARARPRPRPCSGPFVPP